MPFPVARREPHELDRRLLAAAAALASAKSSVGGPGIGEIIRGRHGIGEIIRGRRGIGEIIRGWPWHRRNHPWAARHR